MPPMNAAHTLHLLPLQKPVHGRTGTGSLTVLNVQAGRPRDSAMTPTEAHDRCAFHSIKTSISGM